MMENDNKAKDNQIKCAYCGKSIKKSEAVMRKIYYRGFRGGSKILPYCCEEHGAYDQMSYED